MSAPPLPAVPGALVGDVAHVVWIETVRVPPLLVDGSSNGKPPISIGINRWRSRFNEGAMVRLIAMLPQGNQVQRSFRMVFPSG